MIIDSETITDKKELQRIKKNERAKIWRKNNPDKVKEYSKLPKYIEKKKIYTEANKEKLTEYYKNYRKEHKRNSIRDKEYRKEYYYKNRDLEISKSMKYQKCRKSIDPVFKLSHAIRSALRTSFIRAGFYKSEKTELILGISIVDFYKYIESKFEPWMTWDNHGLWNGELKYGWDLDHIVPITSAKTIEDVVKLNHYTNLRPLCSHTNRYIKRDKIDTNAITAI